MHRKDEPFSSWPVPMADTMKNVVIVVVGVLQIDNAAATATKEWLV